MNPEIAREFTQKFHSLATELGDDDLWKFLHTASLIEVPAGRKLIKSRMPMDSVYLTLSGTLEVHSEGGDGFGKIADIGPGEWLGEVAMFSGDARASASVSTAAPVRLLRLKHQALEDMVSGDGELPVLILRHLVLLMSARLSGLDATLMELRQARKAAGQIPELSGDDAPDKIRYWPDTRLTDASAHLKDFLGGLPGLEGFPKSDFDKFCSSVKVVLYPASHLFTVQGQCGDAVYLVVDGAVAMRSHNPLTNAVTEKVLNAGEWFALPSLAGNLPEFSTVLAIKPVLVLSLTQEDFNRLFDESLALARLFLYMLVNELARRIQVVHAMIRGDGKNRSADNRAGLPYRAV